MLASDAPLQNIILIGFMGTGKSTLGRKLHKTLNYPLIDTDQLIEKQAKRTITNIFKEDGEGTFREMETQLLEDLIAAGTNHHIIATGGGIIVSSEARALLQQLGFVVWLKCTPEKILEHTAHTNHRPLLQCDDPLAAIRDLIKKRDPLYRETAHMELTTCGLAFDEINCGILESARYYFSNTPAEQP